MSGSDKIVSMNYIDRNIEYTEIANRWYDTIEWYNPLTNTLGRGLTEELITQINSYNLNLSPGLLQSFALLKKINESGIERLAEILYPTDLIVSALEKKKHVKIVTEITTSEDYSINETEYEEITYLLKIISLTTYNGIHTFTYKDKKTINVDTTHESYVSDDDSIIIVNTTITTTITEPELDEQDWIRDEAKLDEAMNTVRLSNKDDKLFLYKFALGFDPSLNDPIAYTFLSGLKDVRRPFTGYSNGEYSMNTVVTENSGATFNQIEKILKGTPMEGSAAAFIRAGTQYGIDPAFLVGIAGAEQSFKPFCHNAFGITGSGDAGSKRGFACYSSDEVGIYAAARLLSGPIYVQSGKVTIQDIWMTWAPVGASNDPNNLNSNWPKNVIDVMSRLKNL